MIFYTKYVSTEPNHKTGVLGEGGRTLFLIAIVLFDDQSIQQVLVTQLHSYPPYTWQSKHDGIENCLSHKLFFGQKDLVSMVVIGDQSTKKEQLPVIEGLSNWPGGFHTIADH
jgi:hypothetical protein